MAPQIAEKAKPAMLDVSAATKTAAIVHAEMAGGFASVSKLAQAVSAATPAPQRARRFWSSADSQSRNTSDRAWRARTSGFDDAENAGGNAAF